MSTITTRAGKGSPLTNDEVDANFTNLNNDKLESADLSGYAELTGATFTGDVEATGFNGDLTGAILFKGQAGEALTKGDPVYISGISGNKTVVSKADANDASKMPCFGIVDATVSANADCSVVTFGTLQGLDTSSFSEGDELFVSDTGALTTTAPTGESSQIQKIGKVTRSHASAGSIKVMGAGRTNAVPNLNDGQFFLGNGSNQAVSADFTTSVLGEISAGTGIGISASGVISNTSPDQTVSLTGGTGISTSGTYPNFTITNDSPDQTVSLTGAGTTTVSGTYPNFTITGAGTTYTAGTGLSLTGTEFANTAPDQTVVLTGAGATSISGTYPNFTISSTDSNTTYTAGTGITLSGTTFSLTDTNAKLNLTGGTLTGALSGTTAQFANVGVGASPNVYGLYVYHTDNYEAAQFQTNQGGSLARFTDLTASIEIGVQSGKPVIRTGNTARLTVDGANVQINSGALQMGSTTVIDSSRNLTNIGAYTGQGLATITNSSNQHLRLAYSSGFYWDIYRESTTGDLVFDSSNTSGEFVRFDAVDKTISTIAGYKVNGTTVIDSSRTHFSGIKGYATTATGNTSITASTGIKQTYAEGWTAIFADYDPHHEWGLYHDNPSNYFLITGGVSTNNIGSFSVVNHAGSTRTAYTKIRLDQNTGEIRAGGGYYVGNTQVLDTSRNLTNIGTISSGAIASSGDMTLEGNLLLGGTATTTNQARTIDFTGFDKEGTTDFSDRAFIQHTTNTGGHSGSVLVISSENDANDGIAFETHGSSQLKHNSNTIWTAGNDGSGSGLDADLLDGQQGSYYRNASNLNAGRVPDAQMGTMLHTGSGSAGTLRLINSNELQMYNASGSYEQLHINYRGSNTYISGTNFYAPRSGNLTRAGNTVWDAGNDGSGSGLDADTVDGLQASSFLRSDALTYSSSNIGRANHHLGHLVGSYNNIGGNSGVPNPIYSIGTNYLPTATGLSNFYGVGFAHPNLWGSGKTAGWGLYTTDAGNVTFTAGYSGGTNGIGVWSQGKFVSTPQGTLWGSSNDGSGSGLDADTVDGIQASGFIQSGGSWNASNMPGSRHTGIAVNGGEVVFQRDNPNNGQMSVMVDGNFYAGENNGFWSLWGGNDYNNKVGMYSNTSGHLLLSTTSAYAGGNKIWHAGNDGSGSGLDADTLRGISGDNYLRKDIQQTMSANILFANSTTAKRGISGTMSDNDQWFVGGAGTGSNAGYLEISTGDDGQTSGSAEYIYVRQYGPGSPLTGTLTRTAALLDNYGNTYFPGNVTAYYSDERLKTKTGNITNAIEKVQSLSGFYYVENELAKQHGYSTETQQVGLSAQEVKAVLPEAVSLAPFDRIADEVTNDSVSKSGEEYLTVDYSRLVPLLIESIKELKSEVDDLKTQLETK